MSFQAVARHFPSAKSIRFSSAVADAMSGNAKSILLVGSKDKLSSDALLGSFSAPTKSLLTALAADLAPGSTTTTHAQENGHLVKFTLAAVPVDTTRNNPPARPHAISTFVSGAVAAAKGDVAVVVALEKAEHALAAGLAVARSFPFYNQKTFDTTAKAEEKGGLASIALLHPDISAEQLSLVKIAADAARNSARMVDMPAEEMNTTQFHDEVAKWAATQGDKVSIEAVVGDELFKQQFGGIHGVGRAGVHAPRLVVLKYEPKDAKYSTALVGKGIVYDTGGLSLKISGGMCGMKGDCGGAGGVFGAFRAAVESGQYTHTKLYLVLCLAENAIGPTAFRNDDILTLFSGKTVEINNTDAEGRLVLGDGVAFASKVLKPDLIIDMATLTGAQLITTGQVHAGVVSNKLQAEQAVMRAALRSGDAAFPMLYFPEALMDEFKSEVADMKNSVKSRTNAQSSCAAHFIEQHLHSEWKGAWVHCDIAGPAHKGERATAYGVGLVLDLLKHEIEAVCKPEC